MAEDTAPAADAAASSESPKRAPFPLTRLFFALGFAVVAWFVFWVALLLGLAQ